MTKSKRKLTPKAVLKLPDLPRSPFLDNFRASSQPPMTNCLKAYL